MDPIDETIIRVQRELEAYLFEMEKNLEEAFASGDVDYMERSLYNINYYRNLIKYCC